MDQLTLAGNIAITCTGFGAQKIWRAILLARFLSFTLATSPRRVPFAELVIYIVLIVSIFFNDKLDLTHYHLYINLYSLVHTLPREPSLKGMA